MHLMKWFYRGGRPNRAATFLNRWSAAVHAIGIAPNYLVTLEVRGRRCGRRISVPLVMAVVGGERYLVSMLGADVNWVRSRCLPLSCGVSARLPLPSRSSRIPRGAIAIPRSVRNACRRMSKTRSEPPAKLSCAMDLAPACLAVRTRTDADLSFKPILGVASPS